MKVTTEPQADADYLYWLRHNPKIVKKIHNLIESIKINPYIGIGKPERLRGDHKGMVSRHITGKHRLTYFVKGDTVTITQMHGHYGDR